MCREMSEPLKTVNVRLTPPLADAFSRLSGAIPGLTKGAIMRALLTDALLNKPLDVQVELVTRALLAPAERKSRNGRVGINARSRI
jgi:hypothetical protein